MQQLLELNVAVIQKYNQNDLDTETFLIDALDTAISSFSKTNNVTKVSQLESLKAEFVTSQKGINPYTLQKVTVGRRGLKRTVTFKILQEAEAILRHELNEITTHLEEASLMIQNIVLSAVQSGFLTAEQIQQARSQEAVETIWNDLGKDAALGVVQKKVLLAIGIYDAIIILGDIVATFRDSGGRGKTTP